MTNLPNFLTSLFTPAPNEPKEGDEANPPIWPKDGENNVVVIPSDIPEGETIQQTLAKYEDPQETVTFLNKNNNKNETISTFRPDNHFVDNRTAVLFEPGQYECDFQVGYYTQVLGLGATAESVEFAGKGPYCPAYNLDEEFEVLNPDGSVNHYGYGSSLDTFWRSAENYSIKDNQLWAVSQAAPLRRVHVKGDLLLSDGEAYASGGHLANAQIDGKLAFGSQQQFCSRSVQMSLTKNEQGDDVSNTGPCAWSSVFVDCVNSPPASDSVTLHTPTITVEKPFLVLDSDKKYSLHVPRPRPRSPDSQPLGPTLSADTSEIRDFSRVYVAKAKTQKKDGTYVPDEDVARKINKALGQNKDVVLSPGLYHLKHTINMRKPNQVLLGIGMATLIAPTNGSPCIQVTSPGVRVAGIMLEASRLPEKRKKVASFIEWGVEGVKDAGDPMNPGVMSDVFARVGGSSLDRLVSTDVMIRIHSDYVLGDNLWLWRADHVELGEHELPNFPPLSYHQTVEGEVPVATGLEVNGDHVTIHGLAVEHTTEHQVVWNGENGNVQFYQCELPYDVSTDFGLKNYKGYQVAGAVETHHLGGAGVYSNFRDDNVLVKSAIEHPQVFITASQLVNPFTVHLNNQGVIMTVVSDGKQNGGGPALPRQGPARFELKG